MKPQRIALFLSLLSSVALAHIPLNGTKLNGIKTNGVDPNGINLQGIQAQRRSAQGAGPRREPATGVKAPRATARNGKLFLR